MKQMTRVLIEEQRLHKNATGQFTALVNDLRLACKRIATLIGKGALVGGPRRAASDIGAQVRIVFEQARSLQPAQHRHH